MRENCGRNLLYFQIREQEDFRDGLGVVEYNVQAVQISWTDHGGCVGKAGAIPLRTHGANAHTP